MKFLHFFTKNNFCFLLLFYFLFIFLRLCKTDADKTMKINSIAINNKEMSVTTSLYLSKSINSTVTTKLARRTSSKVTQNVPWKKGSSRPLISVKLLTKLRKLQEAYERSAHQKMLILSPLFLFIFISGLFGNLLVISVCLRDFTKTNALLFSLALSDLTMLFINLPFGFYRHLHLDWPFGTSGCKGVNFLRHLSVYTSSFSNIIIALHRYLSVCCSLQLSPNSNNTNNSSSPSTLARRLCFWERCLYGNRRPHHQPHQYGTAFAMTVIFSPWIAAAAVSLHYTWNSTRSRRFTSLYSMIVQHSDRLLNSSEYQQLLSNSDVFSNGSSTSLNEQKYLPVPSDRQLSTVRCISKPSPLALYFNNQYGLNAVKFDTVTVFLSQYLLPLVISSVLYARVGWTIHQQGQLLTRTGKMMF